MLVIKIGGSVLENMENIARDLKNFETEKFILVHGIGPQVDEEIRKSGKEPVWYTSVSGIRSRYTDQETMEIFNKVVSAENNEIVSVLRKNSINAVGISGANLIRAKRKSKIKIIEDGRKRIIEGDHTGKIERIDFNLLLNLLSNNYLPVISPIAISENFALVNVNADRAAAFIAKELGIKAIVNLSNVPGVLNNGKLIAKIRASELENLMKKVSGGMIMKIFAAREAIEFGVQRVIVASGLVEDPITNALNGNGTVIEK